MPATETRPPSPQHPASRSLARLLLCAALVLPAAVANAASVVYPSVPTGSSFDTNFSDTDYELGMLFKSSVAGTITAIRFYQAPSEFTESVEHYGRIWAASNTLTPLRTEALTLVESGGWQMQTLTTPLFIDANTDYVVSMNVNKYYAFQHNGFSTPIVNGVLTGLAGVFSDSPGAFPTKEFNDSNYFVDVEFAPVPLPAAGWLLLCGLGAVAGLVRRHRAG